MKIKLDENFDARLVPVLAADGHDVDTVSSEGLAGSDDDTIYATCRAVRRVLITLDLDFSNPFRFPPDDTEGIIVVRPPRPILPAIRATLVRVEKGLVEQAGKIGTAPEALAIEILRRHFASPVAAETSATEGSLRPPDLWGDLVRQVQASDAYAHGVWMIRVVTDLDRGMGKRNGTFRDCRDHLAQTRRKVPFPKHYCRSSPTVPRALATCSASYAKTVSGHTSAASTRYFNTPRTTAVRSGCLPPNSSAKASVARWISCGPSACPRTASFAASTPIAPAA